MTGLRVTPFYCLFFLLFSLFPLSKTKAQPPESQFVVIEGEWEGAPWTITFLPTENAPVVFDPVTLDYVTTYESKPDTSPHKLQEEQHFYSSFAGRVTDFRYINPSDPTQGYSVRFEYYWTHKEIRTVTYTWDHLDWEYSEVRTWIDLQGDEGTHEFQRVAEPVDAAKILVSTSPREPAYYRARDYGTVVQMPDIIEEPIQVDSLDDTEDGDYTLGNQTLREALVRAGGRTGQTHIPILVSGTIQLDSQLTVPANAGGVFLFPVAGNVTLDGKEAHRILHIPGGATVEIAGLRFTRGRAPGKDRGGAILNGGNLTLIGCGFDDNTAFDDVGGAVMSTGPVKADGCRFSYNRAGAGAHICATSTINLRDCLFYSGGSGDGGIFISPNGNLTAVNCVFGDVFGRGNSISFWNRSIVAYGLAQLSHCTVLGNPAITSISDKANVTLRHCILSPLERFDGGKIVSNGYNLVDMEESALPYSSGNMEGNLYGDPGLIPVFDDRGLLAGVALSALSPAINAGDPEFFPWDVTPSLQTDAYGNPRVVGGRIDMGATEADNGTLSILDWLLRDADPDKNGDGIADASEALTGRDPSLGKTPKPLFNLVKAFMYTPVGSQSRLSLPMAVPRSHPAGPVADPNPVIGIPIDERVAYLEGTLQLSADLSTWTDLATYRPNGAGQGYTRTAHAAGDIVEEAQSGYVWTIWEEIPVDGPHGYVRLLANLHSGPGTPVITSTESATGSVHAAFAYQVEADGATAFEASGLPAGLALNPATGLISGTPAVGGEFAVRLAAYNESGIGELFTLTLTVLE